MGHYLPGGSEPYWSDPHFALLDLLYEVGPLTWREILQRIGPGSRYRFSEIRLRRARGRVRLCKLWLAPGVCVWLLPGGAWPSRSYFARWSDGGSGCQGATGARDPEQTEQPEHP